MRVINRKEAAARSPNTVTRIETGLHVHHSTLDAVRRVLEAAGDEFTNGDQPGVRLRKQAWRT